MKSVQVTVSWRVPVPCAGAQAGPVETPSTSPGGMGPTWCCIRPLELRWRFCQVAAAFKGAQSPHRLPLSFPNVFLHSWIKHRAWHSGNLETHLTAFSSSANLLWSLYPYHGASCRGMVWAEGEEHRALLSSPTIVYSSEQKAFQLKSVFKSVLLETRIYFHFFPHWPFSPRP